MSKSKKPRRKYDPIRRIRKSIEAAPLTVEHQRNLGLCYHLSFEQMLRGGNEAAWYSLASTLNVCLILCERGFGSEFEKDINAALRSLMQTKYRQQTTGSWVLDEEGIAAIRTALEVHDAQVEIAERREIREAINEVRRRYGSGDVYAEAA